MDPQIAQRTRVNVGAFICAAWSVGALFADRLERWPTGQPSHHVAVSFVFVTLAAVLAFIWRNREDMRRTAVNRWAAGTVVFGLSAGALLRIGAWLAGIPVRSAILFDFVIWCCVCAILGIVMTRRLFVAAAAHLVGFYVAALWPDVGHQAFSAAIGTLAITILFAWPRGPSHGPTAKA